MLNEHSYSEPISFVDSILQVGWPRLSSVFSDSGGEDGKRARKPTAKVAIGVGGGVNSGRGEG